MGKKKGRKIEKITEEEKIQHGRDAFGELYVDFIGLDGFRNSIGKRDTFHMISIDNTYRLVVSIEEVEECLTCGRKPKQLWW